MNVMSIGIDELEDISMCYLLGNPGMPDIKTFLKKRKKSVIDAFDLAPCPLSFDLPPAVDIPVDVAVIRG